MGREPASAGAIGARAYHAATRHSPESVRSGGHFLDWTIKPFPFKIYPDAPALALPRELPGPVLPALEALGRGAGAGGGGSLALDTLAQLLFFSAGLTKKKVYPGGQTVHFRAAASTGALYEVEVYVVAGAVTGLDPGVYHFGPGDFTLRRLRAGDWRAALAGAAGEPPAVTGAPATLVLTAIYWRNTWKYQARAFRHFFWDSGTLLANLLATAAAADVPARVQLGFADDAVNRLLGLDAAHEAALALVTLGRGAPPPPPAPPLEALALATVPLSTHEVDYPLVARAYTSSSLPSGAAAAAWVADGAERKPPALAGEPVSHPLAPLPDPPAVPLGQVILRRGSTRQFAREPVAFTQFSTILDAAVRPLPLDVTDPDRHLVECYLLAHAVDGLPSGAYVHDAARRGLRQLRAGEFRSEGGYLCLEQSIGADAGAVVFFLADLETALARYGDRGYRAVNLVAGLLGGRMYLAAYALGLGASGLTFYDADVVRFFSPDAQGKDAIFVTALGRSRHSAGTGGLAPLEGELRPLRPGDA
jgi:SagB-type dehydrogenase family enzyme